MKKNVIGKNQFPVKQIKYLVKVWQTYSWLNIYKKDSRGD